MLRQWLATSLVIGCCPLYALSPHKAVTQFTRTIWTQAQGLPQDTVRAISQTSDGYLWLGTSEGLARFDGYEFVTYTKYDGSLPNSSVTFLTTGHSGTLWIGTSDGLAEYTGRRFHSFTSKDGLPPGPVTAIAEDRGGVLWIVSGGVLSRFERGKFTVYTKAQIAPLTSARTAYVDKDGELWIGGVQGVLKREGSGFVPVLTGKRVNDNIITSILKDSGGLWFGGSKGLLRLDAGGSLRLYTTADGLTDNMIRAVCEDREGNLWVGANALSRLENGRFVTPPGDAKEYPDWVWSLFEDREGDLWVGLNSELIRLRDDAFEMFGRTEGLPSDQPTVVHEDRQGRTWIGYRDAGLVQFRPQPYRSYTTRDGLPSDSVYSIHETAAGDLLISTDGGLSQMHGTTFHNYIIPDPVGRTSVYDAIQDSRGKLWAATNSGVYRLDGREWRPMVRNGSSPVNYIVTLLETRDGTVWAGTMLNGLWRIPNGGPPQHKARLYSAADGLGSDQIRSLYQDPEGVLWIGTFGGGLTMYRDGVFHSFSVREGLLSDNIFHLEADAAGDFWLSTSRGICRIARQQLIDFAAGKLKKLTPRNYGIADGLRSAQIAPGFPSSGGGTVTSDGGLWFPTTRGLARFAPSSSSAAGQTAPITQIVEVDLNGRPVSRASAARVPPGAGEVQFHYAGIYLSAPERVQYFYKLQGLDEHWIPASNRRFVSYNALPHGAYTFEVRAELPSGGSSESHFDFQVTPRFFETAWFLWLCATVLGLAIYAAHRLRLARIHSRFGIIFEERTRLAREIHDTLAQGFVGISGQLDALAIKLDGDREEARQHLNLARKMARHSLTEARRSVMDLRTSELENGDLSSALTLSAKRWVAGTPVSVDVKTNGIHQLPGELEQNLLRIAQEAVANAIKHARPRNISVELEAEGRLLKLRVGDDGQGFEPSGVLSVAAGHFGILGMRERAERLGGQFVLTSHPGGGTQVEVEVPIASSN